MISENTYNQYLKHLINGNRRECTQIVQGLLKNRIDIKELYLELFQKSLYRVGELWESNLISVAKEHLATAITEGLLNLVYPTLFSDNISDKKVIISCTANELHQIGGKMVADMFEIHGWDSHFLGANTPVDQMVSLIDEVKPNLVGLSLSVYFNMPTLKQSITAIQSDFKHIDLIVGGQAFNWGGAEVLTKHSNISFLPSLTELENYITNG